MKEKSIDLENRRLESVAKLYEEALKLPAGSDQQEKVYDNIVKLEKLAQEDEKIKLQTDESFDKKMSECLEEKKEKRRFIFRAIVDVLCIAVPTVTWCLARRDQIFLETGDRYMKYNSSRNTLNIPKLPLNIKK